LLTLGERRSELHGSDLKTSSSYRYIIANQDMNEDIENVLFFSQKICLRQKQTIKPDDYVVVSIGTGLPMAPVYINKLFSKVSDESNIRIHPHMLRHYFATVTLQSNINNISVMKWLGHAKPDMTEKYFRSNKNSILSVSNEIHGKF
jgi:integrase